MTEPPCAVFIQLRQRGVCFASGICWVPSPPLSCPSFALALPFSAGRIFAAWHLVGVCGVSCLVPHPLWESLSTCSRHLWIDVWTDVSNSAELAQE